MKGLFCDRFLKRVFGYADRMNENPSEDYPNPDLDTSQPLELYRESERLEKSSSRKGEDIRNDSSFS